MTFLEIYTQTRTYLADRADYTVALAKADVNRAYKKICNAFRFYEIDDTDTSIATVDGTSSYSVPSGIREIISMKVTGDTEYQILQQEMGWYERQDTTDDNKGLPEYYIRHGSLFYFWPTPDDAYDIRIQYRTMPDDMSADGDEPVIPEEWHEAIAASAASTACFKYGMAQRGQELKNEYLGLISGVQEDTTRDSRYRIGQMRLQKTRRSTRLGYPDSDYAETP